MFLNPKVIAEQDQIESDSVYKVNEPDISKACVQLVHYISSGWMHEFIYIPSFTDNSTLHDQGKVIAVYRDNVTEQIFFQLKNNNGWKWDLKIFDPDTQLDNDGTTRFKCSVTFWKQYRTIKNIELVI